MKNKPDNVNIINISTFINENGSVSIFGLGNDSIVYNWSVKDATWYSWSQKPIER